MPCVGEDLCGNTDFVPADYPYKIRKDDHVEYDDFSTNNMKDMTMVLGDVKKSRAYGHVVFSAQQFAV